MSRIPWFKVDDDLAFHHKVVAAGNTAMGLWVRAGAWSAQTLTDGFVPKHMVAALGTTSQARKLVEVGLWTAEKGGYRFHEWGDRQPTRTEVDEKRAAARERMRRVRGANNGSSSADVRTNGARTERERSHEQESAAAENFRPSTDSQSVRDLSVTTVGKSDTEENGQVDETDTLDVRANFARSDANPVPSRPDPYIGGHPEGERLVSDAPAPRNDPPPKHHPEHPDEYVAGCADCERSGQAYERHIAMKLAGTEPPRTCKRHPEGSLAPCRDCATARELNTRWHDDRAHRAAVRQSEAAHQAAEDRARAIAACGMCDDDGQIVTEGRPASLCDHRPPPRNRPGLRAQFEAIKACGLCDKAGRRPDGTECDHPETNPTDQPTEPTEEKSRA